MNDDLLFQNISEQLNVNCPFCGEPRLIVLANETKVHGGGMWLQDGDTVFGVYTKLTTEQRYPDGFTYELLVGECPFCNNGYYVVQLNMMNAANDEVDDIIRWNRECKLEQNFICLQLSGVQWVVSKFYTEKGTMLSHTFGPFRLDDHSNVKTIYGVTACKGKSEPWVNAQNILLNAWDTARVLLHKLK